MFRAVCGLAIYLFFFALAIDLLEPNLNPPSYVGTSLLALPIVSLGAYRAARLTRKVWIFYVYGIIAGLLLLEPYWDNPMVWQGIAYGKPSKIAALFYCLFLFFDAFIFSLGTARMAWLLMKPKRHLDIRLICPTCGQPLDQSQFHTSCKISREIG